MPKTPKRPRDLNQWAKRMVDIATGEATDRSPTPEELGKSAAARNVGVVRVRVDRQGPTWYRA